MACSESLVVTQIGFFLYKTWCLEFFKSNNKRETVQEKKHIQLIHQSHPLEVLLQRLSKKRPQSSLLIQWRKFHQPQTNGKDWSWYKIMVLRKQKVGGNCRKIWKWVWLSDLQQLHSVNIMSFVHQGQSSCANICFLYMKTLASIFPFVDINTLFFVCSLVRWKYQITNSLGVKMMKEND